MYKLNSNYKYLLLTLSFFLGTAIKEIHAQYENVWAFGSQAGIDFNSKPPIAIKTGIKINEGCASVCDASGQLLFYTDGTGVIDRNHHTMLNGAALITDIPYLGFTPTFSTSQGALIVPMPDSTNKYYIFSLTSLEYGSNSGRLYYSVVNMALNGGLGAVEPNRKGILLDSMLTEQMSATVGDRCNVWVVVTAHFTTTRQFRSFEVSGSGINRVPSLSSFEIPVSPGANAGSIDISPDGKKLALIWMVAFSRIGGQELYDFSTATGLVSNRIILDSENNGYGTCFSPDNSKLYVTSGGFSQYDLSLGNAAAIINSKTDVGDGSVGALKRGPDGKIYFSGMGTVKTPNLPGIACGYTPNSLALVEGTGFVFGLPNVVPIIKRDSTYTRQHTQPPCFTTNQTLQPANDTTAWGYLWNDGTTAPTLVADSPGIYWVSYHEPPCIYHVDTLEVRFESQLPLLGALAGCYNDSNAMAWAIPATGDTITYSYTWRTDTQVMRGPTFSHQGDSLAHIFNGTTYTLEIRAPNGCDTLLAITTPLPDYQAAFTVSDSIICMGDGLSFQNTSRGNFTNYRWDFQDGTTASIEHPQHIYTHPGSYKVQLIVQTSVPCSDTADKIVQVDSLLPIAFLTYPDSICTGQSILFTPQANHSALSLYWQWGDGNSSTMPNETLPHAYDQDGTLPVQLHARFRACPDATFTKLVYVYPLPLVNLGPDSGLCLNGAPIFLKNLQAPPEFPYQNQWSTGDTTEIIKVVHPGTFSLTAKTAPMGCSTTATLVVRQDCYIEIPNAFTPNGDGSNDYFFPRQLLSRKLTQFSMQLFNRWGQLIFETNRTDGRGWDGKFNGKDQPQGVYAYRIDSEIEGSHTEHYQGNVTLIR